MNNLDKSRETQAGDFLASVSHELRTPLNAVLGMLELAVAAPLSVEQREYLTSALRSARSLAISLEELCDLAYIESDAFTLERAPVDLPSIVWRSVRSLRLPARERGINLTVTIHPDTPQRVASDAWRLQQIVTGVAQHAIQTATCTQLSVELKPHRQTTEGVELLLSVLASDGALHSGAVRAAPDSHFNVSRYSTAGLALMIALRLAEKLDGHLWIEPAEPSVEGRVSCLLKLQPVADDLADPAAPTYASGYGASGYDAELEQEPPSLEPVDQPLRVLVVDDTPANRQVVKAILEKRGHQVELASNGLQAVEHVRRQAFDVVLMDAQMPTMNGLEATEAIRQLPNPSQAATPIIAMTAHALRDDRERCLKAGMNDYLPKPVGVADLLDRIEQHGRPRQTTAPAESPAQAADSLPAESAQAMLRRFGGDRSLLVTLIGLFRDGLPELRAGLSTGLAANDAETVGRAAHNLRGVAANFDDEDVNAALRQIELLARDGSLLEVAPLMAPLDAQLDTLVARLNRVSAHFSADEPQ